MRLALAAALLLAAAPLAAAPLDIPAGKYAVDLSHASVTFKVSHFGLSNYTARFAKFDSTVELDAADPTRSKLTVDIDPKSVRTDYPFPEKTNFDAEIANDARFLNGQPIKFVSTRLVSADGKTGKLTGDLTLRGVTKPVTLDVTLNGAMKSHPFLKKPVFGVTATGTFNRSEFGSTYGAPALGDEIRVTIEAEYQKAA